MIKVDRGTIEIRGNLNTLLSEFSLEVRALKEPGVEDELLKAAFRAGFMSRDELDEAIREKETELKEKIKEFPGAADMLDNFFDKLAEKIAKEIMEEVDEDEEEAPDR